jgi:hypothetical protein
MALFRYDALEFLMVSIFLPFFYLIDFSVALHDLVIFVVSLFSSSQLTLKVY